MDKIDVLQIDQFKQASTEAKAVAESVLKWQWKFLYWMQPFLGNLSSHWIWFLLQLPFNRPNRPLGGGLLGHMPI